MEQREDRLAAVDRPQRSRVRAGVTPDRTAAQDAATGAGGAHWALRLQRTAGNAAVVRLLATRRRSSRPGYGPEELAPRQVPPAAGRPVPVQRATLNIRPATAGTRPGTISGVSNWPDRPASNLRGTQGQHLTAYVVFKDSVLHRVVDRTPAQAALGLRTLLDEFLELPGMQQSNAGYLRTAVADAQARLAAAVIGADVAAIGAEIDTILTIRNQVPGTAERGVGGGHDEASSSAILGVVEPALRRDEWRAEWNEATVADQVRERMWKLLDYDPSPPADDAAREVVVRRLLSHYLSLRSAYPATFAWLTNRGHYLADYFNGHSTDAGIPLQRLVASGYDLTAVFTAIHNQL